MKKIIHPLLIATCLSYGLATPAFAMAPVVDESENFALFDEQLAVTEQPIAFNQTEENNTTDYDTPDNTDINQNTNNKLALAQDDSTDSYDTTPEASSLNKIQSLQQEISELRGQLEVQTHALQTLKQQQLDFYKDLDTRLRNTQTAPQTPIQAKNTSPALNTEPPINTAARGNPADEQISYLAAYELVKNKEFEKATMAMKHFIQQYPRGGYTANAHYWLGELYMTQQSFSDAIQQFEVVLSTFPQSSKSSASSLKLGYALAASGQKDAARERLQSVIRDYPDTHAALLATSKLETLKS